MCRSETGVRIRRVATLLTVVGALLAELASPGRAQVAAERGSLETRGESGALWKRIAGTTVSEGLAGPATGPVRSVWYSPGGIGCWCRPWRDEFSKPAIFSTGG